MATANANANTAAAPRQDALVSVLTRALQDKQREVDELQERLRAVDGNVDSQQPRELQVGDQYPPPAMAADEVAAPEPAEAREEESGTQRSSGSPTPSAASAANDDMREDTVYHTVRHHALTTGPYDPRADSEPPYGGLPPLTTRRTLGPYPSPFAYYPSAHPVPAVDGQRPGTGA
ncbi:hypothetical protein MIND_00191300 [Mycena indigotica]|uniref:Uncharacterized protein n=1 Tax=Mycena indigotica TaxID=2126181 RepID=A0A8H6WEF8_9AGAR|nr:uncharacterized protein MIND_00191300 [Mycena indigotica]KAF7311808.1 hypothetical protein MIND_00191300 [Mycena indigotica]